MKEPLKNDVKIESDGEGVVIRMNCSDAEMAAALTKEFSEQVDKGMLIFHVMRTDDDDNHIGSGVNASLPELMAALAKQAMALERLNKFCAKEKTERLRAEAQMGDLLTAAREARRLISGDSRDVVQIAALLDKVLSPEAQKLATLRMSVVLSIAIDAQRMVTAADLMKALHDEGLLEKENSRAMALIEAQAEIVESLRYGIEQWLRIDPMIPGVEDEPLASEQSQSIH